MHRVTPALLAVYAEDGAAYSFHCKLGSHASGSSLGCNQFFQEQGVVPALVHAERDLSKHVRPAGGTMLTDLFQADDGGWIEDTALLDP